MLQWARQSGCSFSRVECGAAAAGGGHLETLQLLAKEAKYNVYLQSLGAGKHAAAGGHIHVLEWLHAKPYIFHEDACYAAAEHGHLAALQWLRAHGCPWNREDCLSRAGLGQAGIRYDSTGESCLQTCAEICKWLTAQAEVEVEGDVLHPAYEHNDDDDDEDDEENEEESESEEEYEIRAPQTWGVKGVFDPSENLPTSFHTVLIV
jgi:hypothetical protein